MEGKGLSQDRTDRSTVAKGFDQSRACQCCADHDNIVKAFLTSTAIQLPALALPSEDLDRLWDKLYGACCKG